MIKTYKDYRDYLSVEQDVLGGGHSFRSRIFQSPSWKFVKALRRLEREQGDLEKRARRYGLSKADWADATYSPAEQDRLAVQIDSLRGRVMEVAESLRKLSEELNGSFCPVSALLRTQPENCVKPDWTG